MADYATEHRLWAEARLAALKAEDGWLNLTDRIGVEPGVWRVGRAADNDLVLSAGPDHLGTLTLAGDGGAVLDTGAASLPFVPVPDNPPRLKTGGLLLEIHSIEGERSLRVRDLASSAPGALQAIDSFPLDPAWRIEAGWQALPQAETLGIGTVAGVDTSVRITHCARFAHDGAEVVLLPTHWKGGKPMFVIRDATSGRETYGASRFLIGEVRGDLVVLDFNRAFNPPCAFTDLAVCPLPPRQNILPFAIRAGEKRPPV